MSDERNEYGYIISKQAMGNLDDANRRIDALVSENKTLQEQNDNLSFLSHRAGNVYSNQRLGDFISFINDHLLAGDLEIEFHEEDEDGLVFHIPDAVIKDGSISRTNKTFTVTGNLMLDWTVEVTAADADEAEDIAQRHIDGADIHAYFSHNEQVDEADIDNYNLTVEVSDVYEN